MKKHSRKNASSSRKQTRNEVLTVTGALLSLSQLPAGAAGADEAAAANKKKEANNTDEIAEVVVTGKKDEKLYKAERLSSNKYTKPLRDVPQTVTVIPREVIEEQGATTLTEVLRNVPGIAIQAGEGGGASSTAGDMFNMRGFDASNSIFVDGVRDNGLISRDSFNMETVEAFLGPTGSDVGRGTAAGYVNTVTKMPKLDNRYAGSLGYGSADSFRATADMNQSLGSVANEDWLNHAAVRLNAMYDEGKVLGREDVENQSYGFAPSIALGLETDTRIFLYSQHVRQDNLPDYGTPVFRGHHIPGVDDEWYYGSEKSNHEDISQDSVTAVIEHDFSDAFTLRNLTRYNTTYRDAVITSPGYSATTSQITRSLQGNERQNDIFTNQTSLTAKFETGQLKHSLVTAIEFTDERQRSHTGTASSTNGTAPDSVNVGVKPDDFDLPRPPVTSMTHGTTDTLGVSVFDTIDLTKKWQLTGGVRMDSYDTDYHARTQNTTTKVWTPTNIGVDDTVYSGKVGLTYKPVDEGSVYVAYGTTVTPPGGTNFTLSSSASNQNNPSFDPQESESIELGTKWDLLDEKLQLSTAIFRTKNTNVVYTEPGTNDVHSDGDQLVNGVTAGATGKITEEWQVIASATYQDGEYDQPGYVYDGFDLTRTPKVSGSLWTTYKLPWKLTVGIGARYQGETNYGYGNTPATTTTPIVYYTYRAPSYVVFDSLLQYDVNEHMNVRLNVFNMFDQSYVTSINNNGQRSNKGTPASFMLTTNFTF
jgi:catecholate siderophore receptor